MNEQTQTPDFQTQGTLTCAASLATAIIMRLTGNGITGVVNGEFITRTSVASAALNTITGKLTS